MQAAYTVPRRRACRGGFGSLSYIHSPSSMMDMNDYNNTIRLMKEF